MSLKKIFCTGMAARTRGQTLLSPTFFRLLCKIAKIAFITARIIASLDFIYAVQCMIHFIYHFVR